jgi:hypothetical protein
MKRFGAVLAAALMLVAASSAASGQAQTTPPQATPAATPQATPAATPQATPAATSPAGRPADALDFGELRNFLTGQLQVVQRLQRQVDEGMRDAQQAVQTYDEMVTAYRALSDAVGSKSGQVTQIDEFIALYEKYAEEALGSANQNVRAKADELRRIARVAREIRAGFIDESAKALANIDRLKDFKEEAIVNFRIRRGQEVNLALRGQLEALQTANQRVDAEIKKAEQQNLPTVGPRVQ